MSRHARSLALAATIGAASVLLVGCAANGETTIEVNGSGTSCELAERSADAGTIDFEFHNNGNEEAEFYLYAANGEDIVSEVEGVGPGTTRTMSVEVEAGSYVAACKSEDNEEGVRVDFTVK